MIKFFISALLLATSLYAKQNVVLQLLWLHQFQFAGFYMAKEKGFYDAVGIDVTLLESNNQINTVENVLQGKVDFAVGRPSLIIDKANKKEVALLMAILQRSPSVLLSIDPSIQKLSDLHHKRVMVTPDEINAISIKSMLMIEGIQKKNIQIQMHSLNLEDLLLGNTDAMACYTSNEPYTLSKKGIHYTLFHPKDYGMDFYGDILYTSNALIKKDPKLVQKFYEASKKGWLYAFENIQESAELILKKYNTQNKTLEHLLFEGNELKKLAFDSTCEFGTLDKKRINEIANIYKLFKVIPENFSLENFIDPLRLSKEKIKIGILAHRGVAEIENLWQNTVQYLNNSIDEYHFEIVPLLFDELQESVKKKQIDFIITNPLSYIQLSYMYNINRIATLKNYDQAKNEVNQFGGVIFTQAENHKINSLIDLKGKRFGAVDKNSFGGWIVGKNELLKQGLNENAMDLHFFNTHDNVLYTLLDGKIDAGIVRTDTLESMVRKNKIALKKIKILNEKKYENFPYKVSTELYPEWPLAKLAHTDDNLAFRVLSSLVSMTEKMHTLDENQSRGWGIPQDYTKIDQLLKKLKIYPFNQAEITYQDVLEKYQYFIFVLFFLFIATIFTLFYIKLKNKHLEEFNKKLEESVKKRTRELHKSNQKLLLLANTDALTAIDNRRHFFEQISNYIKLSKRNHTPLIYLSLDIDHFKHINDTYGHLVGDEVLKLFTTSVKNSLRESDLFGRIGGEEFAVCLQNTDLKGAIVIAEKIRKNVQDAFYSLENQKIYITVSIGIADCKFQCTLEELMKNADSAMYQAKENGRNTIIIAN